MLSAGKQSKICCSKSSTSLINRYISKCGRYHSSIVNSGLWRLPASSLRKTLLIWKIGPLPAASKRFMWYSGLVPSHKVFESASKGAINSVLKVERWRSVTPNSLNTGVSTSNKPRSVKKRRISAIILARFKRFSMLAEGCQAFFSDVSTVTFPRLF